MHKPCIDRREFKFKLSAKKYIGMNPHHGDRIFSKVHLASYHSQVEESPGAKHQQIYSDLFLEVIPPLV